MINSELKLKNIFDSFMVASDALNKSYKQYDDVVKQDVLFDFTNEFFMELAVYLKCRDDYLDLVEEYREYIYNH